MTSATETLPPGLCQGPCWPAPKEIARVLTWAHKECSPKRCRGPAVPLRGTLPGYLHEQISIYAPGSTAKAPAGTQRGLLPGYSPQHKAVLPGVRLSQTLCVHISPLPGCFMALPLLGSKPPRALHPSWISFLLFLCRLQTCKAERLADLELLPSLTRLCLSLCSHTTAEQLSTVPPAPHLQQIPLQIPGTATPGMRRTFPTSCRAAAPPQPQGHSSCVQWPGNKWEPWEETKYSWLRQAHTRCLACLGCDPHACSELLLWPGAALLPLHSSAVLGSTCHRSLLV